MGKKKIKLESEVDIDEAGKIISEDGTKLKSDLNKEDVESLSKSNEEKLADQKLPANLDQGTELDSKRGYTIPREIVNALKGTKLLTMHEQDYPLVDIKEDDSNLLDILDDLVKETTHSLICYKLERNTENIRFLSGVKYKTQEGLSINLEWNKDAYLISGGNDE